MSNFSITQDSSKIYFGIRTRQLVAIDKIDASVNKHGKTLLHAPTGAGKTFIFCGWLGRVMGSGIKSCVLAHRDVLCSQNRSKFDEMNPWLSTSVVNSIEKNWNGDAVFAMVQTLSREKNLAQMPRLDVLVIDEAHHAVAKTYQRIIDRAYELNPALSCWV